jgi:hypothetical protein
MIEMDVQVDTSTAPASPRVRSHRARWSAIGAAVAVVLGAGGLMTATAVENSGEKSVFVPITPCRVMDTRAAPQTVGPRSKPLAAAETHTIAITGTNGNCTIPGDATGVSMNVTAVNPTADSFLTVFPADAPQPLASNLNYAAGQNPVPNAVTVDLSANGRISFYNNGGTADVVADIVGYYQSSAHDHDDRYYTEAEVYNKAEVNAHEADQKHISIELLGLETDATLFFGSHAVGLEFSDTSSDNVVLVNFVAPPDLTPNTSATMRVSYFIKQVNCTVSLGPRAIWVAREGETSPSVPFTTDPDQPGIVPVGGDPRPAPASIGASAIALYTLGLPEDGSGFRPGDAVTVGIGRNGPLDTCTNDLIVTGIEILYS